MATTLEGSTALVTGATAGIGIAIAQQLAALGAKVVVHGRSPQRGAETVQAIEDAGGNARFVAADLSRADEVRRLADEAGPVDILINNAGVYRFGATADTDDAFFDEHVNLNLRAPYILVQKLVSGMAERGHGTVVNISTVAASTPARQAGIYGATKAGVELLTRVWADEFGPSGVRVNTVAAGPTETPGTAVTPGLTDGLATTTTLADQRQFHGCAGSTSARRTRPDCPRAESRPTSTRATHRAARRPGRRARRPPRTRSECRGSRGPPASRRTRDRPGVRA